MAAAAMSLGLRWGCMSEATMQYDQRAVWRRAHIAIHKSLSERRGHQD